ncbi:hypothetical protein O3S81_10460 [Agrobacterium sp. SOY23]|uniref:hypothetical protein n=1 Tax=Agrobacterium sp. SOY23 TaxID=3014555 RepID=UPI0022AF4561|nr:hypothetical protein [Agrobacterium sp. SOY23]MCZ4430123.1 hypothetical protein [Agrobacterium sp. SOY23]
MTDKNPVAPLVAIRPNALLRARLSGEVSLSKKRQKQPDIQSSPMERRTMSMIRRIIFRQTKCIKPFRKVNASYNIMTILFYYRCQDEAKEKQA